MIVVRQHLQHHLKERHESCRSVFANSMARSLYLSRRPLGHVLVSRKLRGRSARDYRRHTSVHRQLLGKRAPALRQTGNLTFTNAKVTRTYIWHDRFPRTMAGGVEIHNSNATITGSHFDKCNPAIYLAPSEAVTAGGCSSDTDNLLRRMGVLFSRL
jgi:hypothetical protein